MYGCVYHKEDGFCEKFSDDRCKSYCVMGPCQYAIPSNADRIRSMTDEELAEWLTAHELKAYARIGYSGNKERFKMQYMEWLKSAAEEVDE